MSGQVKAVITAALILLAASGAFVASAESAAEHALTVSKSCRRIDARIVKKVPIPRWYHEGLYYDGESIWLCNGEKGKMWVVDTDSGVVRSEIETVAGFTESIAAKGDGTFFTAEWDEKKVYRVRLEGNRLIAEDSFSVCPAHPAGIAWDGNRLFIVTWTRGVLGTRFALLVTDGTDKVLEKISINAIQEPDQLAWDGAYLWISSWYDQRVYKIDTAAWQITASFCSPAKKTTGIAWDGAYLWLTGTYADLYRMDLNEAR